MAYQAVNGLSFYGKLVSRSDFVRYNATAPVFRSIDEWIQGGLMFAAGGRVPGFERSYDAAGTSRFVLPWSTGSDLIAGSIRPSRDAAGRRYPFFVAAALDRRSFSGTSLAGCPYLYAPLFECTDSLVNKSVESQLTVDELTSMIQQSVPDQYRDQAPGLQHSAVLRSIPFGQFCRSIWGAFDDSRKYATFKNLLDVLLPLRGKGQPRLSYGLVLPLAAGSDQSSSVSFWLELCARILKIGEMYPALIWNTRVDSNRPSGSLYLNFSAIPASGFLQIAGMSPDIDSIFVLENLGRKSAAEIALSIPDHYGRAIENEHLSLLDVITAFEQDV